MSHSAAKLAVFQFYKLLEWGILPYATFAAAVLLAVTALVLRLLARQLRSLPRLRIVAMVLAVVVSSAGFLHIYTEAQEHSWRRFAEAYVRAGAANAAEECLAALEARRRWPVFCQFQRGVLAYRRQQFGQAVEHFSSYVARLPADVRGWSNLVQAQISAGAVADAARTLANGRPYIEGQYPGTFLLLEIRLLRAQGNEAAATAREAKARRHGLLPAEVPQ